MKPEDKKGQGLLWALGLAAVGVAAGIVFRKSKDNSTPLEKFLELEKKLLADLPQAIAKLEASMPHMEKKGEAERLLRRYRKKLSSLKDAQQFDDPEIRRQLYAIESSSFELEERNQLEPH